MKSLRAILVVLSIMLTGSLVAAWASGFAPVKAVAQTAPTATPDGSQPIQWTTADIMEADQNQPPPVPQAAPLPVEPPVPGSGAPPPLGSAGEAVPPDESSHLYYGVMRSYFSQLSRWLADVW
jgi:hypothetical protein